MFWRFCSTSSLSTPARLPQRAREKELRAALHLLSLDIDGRLDAAVVALDVGDAFHRVGEDDAEDAERVDDRRRAAL